MLVKFVGGNLCHLEELLVRDDWVLIEEKKEEHLIGGAEELVPLAFLERATDLRIAQSQLPVQKTPIVEL